MVVRNTLLIYMVFTSLFLALSCSTSEEQASCQLSGTYQGNGLSHDSIDSCVKAGAKVGVLFFSKGDDPELIADVGYHIGNATKGLIDVLVHVYEEDSERLWKEIGPREDELMRFYLKGRMVYQSNSLDGTDADMKPLFQKLYSE